MIVRETNVTVDAEERAKFLAKRHAALDELTRLSEEMGLYDMPPLPPEASYVPNYSPPRRAARIKLRMKAWRGGKSETVVKR